MILDEVDSGIGGAVGAAVGERLQRLGTSLQVLVVTHSPQVAARGAHHWRVAKRLAERATVTRVEELDPDTRQEEIARMLSGRIGTAEARAAAASLIPRGRASAPLPHRRSAASVAEDVIEIMAEPKIDGLSIGLTYLQGRLVQGATRGDGVTGENVTTNLRTLKSVPEMLSGAGWPELIEIRGEVYLERAGFFA